MERIDVSVVMPCRNEEDAVGACVDEARRLLAAEGLQGEILVVDNASTDRSAEIAAAHGARVVREDRPGYGNALRAGIAAARGRAILMGDCDTTYSFLQANRFLGDLLAGKCDIVIGDRFAGGIEKGAMPLNHRLGVRFLSRLGRWKTKTNVRDFHCGLRGLTKEAAEKLDFRAEGMEFATEMIALAARAGMRIGQYPVSLRKCTRNRKSKLRTLPDGIRHLKYLLGIHGTKEEQANG